MHWCELKSMTTNPAPQSRKLPAWVSSLGHGPVFLDFRWYSRPFMVHAWRLWMQRPGKASRRRKMILTNEWKRGQVPLYFTPAAWRAVLEGWEK